MKIQVHNLCKQYDGVPVLENVSFTAGNGGTERVMSPVLCG